MTDFAEKSEINDSEIISMTGKSLRNFHDSIIKEERQRVLSAIEKCKKKRLESYPPEIVEGISLDDVGTINVDEFLKELGLEGEEE
jgi:hypothetical protein